MKKIFLCLLALILALSCLASCAAKHSGGVSSTTASTEQSSDISVSSEKDEPQSSTITTVSSDIKTSSKEQSKPAPVVSKKPDRPTSSQSESESVKVYKNKRTVELGAYQFRLNKCTANGNDEQSRLEEYKSVIKEGYFNTFFINLDTDILTHLEVIGEAGGSIWISMTPFHSTSQSLDSYIENIEYYLNLIKDMGYGDLVNGFAWDEPVWHGQTNADFLAMTNTLYHKFGLRNFPVFATGEFSGLEGNEIGKEADDMDKVMTSSLKYVTDVAFDAYGVDVRDGVVPTQATLDRWREKISPNINTSKDYYTEYKNKLLNHVGHPANIWYYPCCYKAPVGTGLNGIKRADEGYCLGHLEFMAEDILSEQYGAGLVLYTFSGETGLERHLPLKDEKGNYKYSPDEVKWDTYCAALKRICKKFSAKKVKLAPIGA